MLFSLFLFISTILIIGFAVNNGKFILTFIILLTLVFGSFYIIGQLTVPKVTTHIDRQY